jgi:hypothetical protein
MNDYDVKSIAESLKTIADASSRQTAVCERMMEMMKIILSSSLLQEALEQTMSNSESAKKLVEDLAGVVSDY